MRARVAAAAAKQWNGNDLPDNLPTARNAPKFTGVPPVQNMGWRFVMRCPWGQPQWWIMRKGAK